MLFGVDPKLVRGDVHQVGRYSAHLRYRRYMVTHELSDQIEGHPIDERSRSFNWHVHQGVVFKAAWGTEVLHNPEKACVFFIDPGQGGVMNSSAVRSEVDQSHPGSWINLRVWTPRVDPVGTQWMVKGKE